eukprot:CAMPEP_0206147628 /NCGR_PEP_ID=MMETSP1473-20131121/34009_1 /ASSEMBLY_ACC=CAM_ASM_001109 /TAXON_ID=1461547 /ORGANISM="Stichococcus sp, Strain RCC1054" /LENGTH=117 /DNA_ID=CAMNT_0053544635 /DNA_START=321 /DNA_END=671 /DNA_ORIENTATION=+
MDGNSGQPHRLKSGQQPSMELYIAGAVGAVAIFVCMGSLPILSALLWIVVGVLMALLVLVAGVVGAWYTLSEPYKRPAEESTSVGDTASGEKVGATAEGAQPQERTTYAQLVEHMIP